METRAKIDFFYDKNEDWESTYNNQNFFEYNLHRMRYLVVDTELKNNPFEGCVDLETLEVKNQLAFERLKQYTHEDLLKLGEVNEWDWIGDDFEHMWQYLGFIADHDKTLCITRESWAKMNTWTSMDITFLRSISKVN